MMLASRTLGAAIAAAVILGFVLVAVPSNAYEGTSVSISASSRGEVVPPPAAPSMPAAMHPLSLPFDGDSVTSQVPSAAQPQGKSAPSSTASISGHLTSALSPAQDLGGVHVRAVIFTDAGDSVKFQQETVTDADGDFTFGALAPASYWIEFYDDTNFPSPTYQWWGSELMNPAGKPVPVTDGEAATANWQLTPAAHVSGLITCEQCPTPPDAAQTSVVFAAMQASQLVGIAEVPVDSTGAYDSEFLYPSSYYVTVAVFSGGAGYNKFSDSVAYSAPDQRQVHSNVVISRHLNPVAGVQPAIDSVVNALYWDFLSRSPSASDITFWNNQFSLGASPGDVGTGFVTSDEYRLIRIDAAYQSVLGRTAEQGGRMSWLSAMRSGGITTDDIETSLYASQEYYQQHGGSNTSFVKSLYAALLHREGTASDYAFWANLVAQHGRAWVIGQYWNTTETISERVSAMYQFYLGRVPDAGGLQGWVNLALQIGDSGLRSGFTGSDEYFVRSQYRYSERTDG